MSNFPKKKSPTWYVITVVIFGILFFALIFSRYLLNIQMDMNNILAFALIAAILAITAGVGGLLGGKTFVAITGLAYLVATIQLLYIAARRFSDGWSDLTSVIGFLTISIGGVALGLIVQAILSLCRHNFNQVL